MRVPGEPFTARFPGRCRGCHEDYHPGERIASPGKGGGAYHLRCWDTKGLVTRQMTPEEQLALDMRRRHRQMRGQGGW